MTDTPGTKDAAAAFIERVEDLGNGELAQLRRACGAPLAERTDALWFVGLVRGAAREDVAFLVASLLAQYKTQTIRSGGHNWHGPSKDDPDWHANVGDAWRLATKDAKPDASIRRRMHILLDSSIEADGGGDLPYRLRQMVRYLAAHGIGLDWPQLLRDLRRWNYPDRNVQKAWARSYFSGDAEPKP